MQIAHRIPSETRLVVPAALASALATAVSAGRDEAARWAQANPTGSPAQFEAAAITRLGPPPSGAAAEDDLDVVRRESRGRTADENARAVELANRTGWETWNAVLADIGRTQGVAQARCAAALVQQATSRTDAISDQGKRMWGRTRPYDLDPSIAPVVSKPGHNPSYPSGHSSAAYAVALVLASIVPERAAEFVDLAAEVAYSRVYGGVHFPSDVIAGARIASAVVTDVLRRAQPV